MELPHEPRARGNRAALPRPANDDDPRLAQGRQAPITPTETVRPTPLYPATPPQTFVVVGSGDGLQCLEGVIVGGTLDADGAWNLDGLFTLRTEDGDLFRVHGWACTTEVQ